MVHPDPDQPPHISRYIAIFAACGALLGLGPMALLALAGAGDAAVAAYFAAIVASTALGAVLGVRATRNYWRSR